MNENWSVADMIEDNKWIWPENWVSKFDQVRHMQVPVLVHDRKDMVKWMKSNGQMVNFSIREAWKDMKCSQTDVFWWKVIWFSQCNPRCAFTLWMAVKERLATQDRVMKWKNIQLLCPLCNLCNDSHNHLFFNCNFSSTIWNGVKHKTGLSSFPNHWLGIVEKVADLPCSNSIRSVSRRILFATTVYYIWKERNSRLFSNTKRSAQDTLQIIEDSIRLQLQGLKVKESAQVKAVAVG